MDCHPVQAGVFDAAISSAEHSALPCIFTEDTKIPLKVSYLFVISFNLATTFGYEDREADYWGGGINCIWKLCFCRKLV